MNLLVHLRRNAQYLPDKLAISDGSTKFTWAEFEQRTRSLTASLAQLGIQKGDRVGVLMSNNYRYMETYYALPRIGAIIVPLNIRYSPVECAFVLNDCGAVALLFEDSYLPVVEKFATQLESVRHFVFSGFSGQQNPPDRMLDYEELIAKGQSVSDYRDVQPDEEDILGLFYTGGTTGRSKGVMLTHRNLVANALNSAALSNITADTVYCHMAPMFHIADAQAVITYTMMAARHTFLPKFDPPKALEIIERERVTHIGLVPTMINLMLQVPNIKDYDLSSLKLIFSGGSPTPAEVIRKLRQLLPCSLRQGYGLTEAAPGVTTLDWEVLLHALAAPPDSRDAQLLLSCGIAGLNIEVRIVNAEGQDVAPGEIGEIIARGPNIMKGYWNLPDETRNALRDGWLYTGDMATIDERNYIYIVDRKKDMIITGGENVYSAEVENAIYSHPAVLEAAVIGVPDEKWGERVHAVVVLKPGMQATEAEIVAKCRELISGYKVPRSMEFVAEMPRSGAGKILKRTLREKYWQSGVRQVN
jgi:long-chain acyl-CoA synthetase